MNGKLAEYFKANRHQPKYFIGDWVFGKYEGIPFIGTVGNEEVIDEESGPRVSVHLFLPIVINHVRKNLIFVKPESINSTRVYE
jgi:hypothetical protein